MAYGPTTALHPLTLSFADSELERSFMQQYIGRSLPLVRLSVLLAAGLFLVYHFLDRLIFPEVLGSVLVVRLLVAAFLLAALGLTFYSFFQERLQVLMSIVVLVGGGSILYLIHLGEDMGGHEYYGGLMLAVIYAHALLRLRFVYATATTWCIIAVYAAMVYKADPSGDNVLISHVVFLATANVLGMVSSYGLEYYVRMVFLTTQQLEERGHALELEDSRKATELNAAREIQLSLLPRHAPHHPYAELAVSMLAVTEVGGDFYDFHVADDGTLTFAIGDATGHGTRAGAMVTAMKMLFCVLAPQPDLVEIVRQSARAIRGARFPRLYMALAAGRLKENVLELVGAGLPPALLYRASTGDREEIALKGLPLGAPSEPVYTSSLHKLESGDTIAFMTDGFAELRDGSCTMLGYEKAAEAFWECADEGPDQIIRELQKAAQSWRHGHRQDDDITFLVLRLRPVPHTSPARTTSADGQSLEVRQSLPEPQAC